MRPQTHTERVTTVAGVSSKVLTQSAQAPRQNLHGQVRLQQGTPSHDSNQCHSELLRAKLSTTAAGPEPNYAHLWFHFSRGLRLSRMPSTRSAAYCGAALPAGPSAFWPGSAHAFTVQPIPGDRDSSPGHPAGRAHLEQRCKTRVHPRAEKNSTRESGSLRGRGEKGDLKGAHGASTPHCLCTDTYIRA